MQRYKLDLGVGLAMTILVSSIVLYTPIYNIIGAIFVLLSLLMIGKGVRGWLRSRYIKRINGAR